ncbi:hypothetical protein V6N13_059492 [Hibiscus sabdariffa]
MTKTRLAQDHASQHGSSTEGESLRMKQNPPQQVNPQGQVEPFRGAPQAPNAQNLQNVQQDYLLSMKEMFEQLTASLRKESPVTPSTNTHSRAPINKLA